jgi:thiol-disulfide isomerase/thioredoxin
MISKIKNYVKEIISFIVILLILSNVMSYYRATDLNKEKFPLENISLENKPLLIHFWAVWCPTCKIEASNIEMLSKDYHVITIAVNSGEDKNINEYLESNNLTFNVINDKDSVYAKKFNISVFPTTLIYDKNKNLVFSEVGYTSTIGLYIRMWWANF